MDFHRFNQRVFQQNRPKGDIDAALGSLRKCAAPLLIGLPSTRKEESAPVRSIGLMALKTLLTCPQPSI